MPKEGASLCVSMCVQSVSQPVSFSAICLCPAVCQRLIGRGLRELLKGYWAWLGELGVPQNTPPPPSSFFLPLLHWEQEEGGLQ